MKSILTILAVVAAVVILLGLIILGFKSVHKQTVAPGTSTSFPVATTTSGGGMAINLRLSDGSAAVAKDFIDNGVTVADPANKGNYYLQGTSGACLPDGTCPSAGSPKKFTIVYFSQEQAFGINLDDEPLGQTRLDAENYLSSALGLTHDQMCLLNYTLGTTGSVSTTYGGMGNLGFSFCPGAVQLPF